MLGSQPDQWIEEPGLYYRVRLSSYSATEPSDLLGLRESLPERSSSRVFALHENGSTASRREVNLLIAFKEEERGVPQAVRDRSTE